MGPQQEGRHEDGQEKVFQGKPQHNGSTYLAEQQDIDVALNFLKGHTASWQEHGWCVQLAAIEPDSGAINVISVPPRWIDELEPWIEQYQGKRGIYFCVNPLKHSKKSKARKDDIAALTYLHVDIDPRDGAPLADERQRLQGVIEHFPISPSELVDSGNGFGVFFKLADPALVEDNAEELEEWNRRLAQHLGADHCHNIDRIMRLPGTMNMPSEKKVAKGRSPVPVPAKLINQRDVAYTLEQFDFLPPVEKQHKGTKANDSAAQTGLPSRFLDLLASDGELLHRWEGKMDGLKDTSRSGLDMSLVAMLVHRGFGDAEITTILHAFPHGKVVQDGRDDTYVCPMLAKARKTRLLSRTDPMRTARRMIAEQFTDADGAVRLRHWRGDFYLWQDGVYRQLDDNDVKPIIYSYLESARVAVKKNATESFKPKKSHVSDVLDALEACVHLDSVIAPPCRLDGDGDATNLIAMGNGVLDLSSRQLLPFDPALFLLNGVPFDYNPEAELPMAWLAFLHQLWPDDPESIETLQEFFGYMLTSDTSRQKILLLDGPKRAGKGVIADVLRATIGAANCVAPTLSSLGANFGLQPLIGKSLAIVSDARLGRADLKVLAERLLSISGQDTLSIPQKYKGDWTGKLGVRLMMLTNELPEIEDESGALASRFIVLRLTKSFYGREDFGLKDRLMQELPGIFNWALRGLERLKARGQFRQPATAKELVHELENLGSPMSAFLRDCCVVEPNAMVEPQALYQQWKMWCHTQGIDHAGPLQTFCRNLRAALPSITITQPRENGDQKRCYAGVGLKAEMAGKTPQEIRKRLF